jgi:hypothetical protein
LEGGYRFAAATPPGITGTHKTPHPRVGAHLCATAMPGTTTRSARQLIPVANRVGSYNHQPRRKTPRPWRADIDSPPRQRPALPEPTQLLTTMWSAPCARPQPQAPPKPHHSPIVLSVGPKGRSRRTRPPHHTKCPARCRNPTHLAPRELLVYVTVQGVNTNASAPPDTQPGPAKRPVIAGR